MIAAWIGARRAAVRRLRQAHAVAVVSERGAQAGLGEGDQAVVEGVAVAAIPRADQPPVGVIAERLRAIADELVGDVVRVIGKLRGTRRDRLGAGAVVCILAK